MRSTQYPSFPTQSLSGSFPGFPVNYINIPNLVDLPGYIISVTTYYGNPFNFPYANPPIIASWRIPYPNIFGIFGWFVNVIWWVLGWAGAIFKYALTYASAGIINLATWIINIGTGTITSILTATQTYADKLGIWGIPLEATVAGLLIVALILIVFGIVRGVQTIIEMIP